MNRALPEMLHCLKMPANIIGGKGMEMSVLERQRMVLKWQQEQLFQVQPTQQQLSCFNDLSMLSFFPPEAQDFQGADMNYCPSSVTTGPTLNELLNRPIKADPGAENGWMDFGMQKSGITVGSMGIETAGEVHNNPGYETNYGISRTASCPPSVAKAAATSLKAARDAKGRETLLSDQKLSGAVGRESFKKRKAERNPSTPKVVDAEEDNQSKKSKGCAEEEESKITEQRSNKHSSSSSQGDQKESNGHSNDKKSKETSGCTSKDSKASEVQKPDYIHVRARRGQATDSHSLAERVRREKISERMKYLQDLVPGCNKITGKAGMLDEIINYVQSLQRQVEFLSMKLAAVNPRLDINIDELIAKEVFAACSASLPTMGVSPDLTNPSYLQYNPVEQMDPICGSTVVGNPIDLGLRRSISAPVPVPETFLDTSCFNQIPNSLQWDAELQNIYNMEFQQGRSTSFPLQTFTGTVESSSLKMEM